MLGTQATTAVFIARQPILQGRRDVYGYELLFRASAVNSYDGADGDAATRSVITRCLVDIGLDELTGGRRAFLNFSRNLLLQEIADLLPPDRVVLEILEDVVPDAEVLARCRRLKDAGYLLALDDFIAAHAGTPLLELADFVKVDVAQTTAAERARIVADLQRRGIKALAEKVETEAEFQETSRAGYAYFQGHFFSRAVVRQGKSIAANKLAHLKLMDQVNRPELSLDDIEAILNQDVALTYKLLRFINSAWFGLRHKVDSTRHALAWLGRAEIRKWYTLVSLIDLGSDEPSELHVQAMTRAKMAETLAGPLGLGPHAPGLFLMGMFSLIDVLLGTPMAEILPQLPLDEPVRAALAGEPSTFREVLDLVVCYEGGNWDDFSDRAARLGLDPAAVPAIYKAALKWASQAFDVV